MNGEEIIERFKGAIDIENIPWNVGLIVGKSGTGKSTIAREVFGKELIQNYSYVHEAIVDDMPKEKTMPEIIDAFNSVGFASSHSWIKPYSVLSNGEKMRVDLARAILENHEMFAFDEFTSVVDRNIAQIGSFAIQRAVRKLDKRFVAITCHTDVADWLLPDWIFNTDTMSFEMSSKKKDQTSTSVFIEQQTKIFGGCLLSITI